MLLPNKDAADYKPFGLASSSALLQFTQAFVTGFVYIGYKMERHNDEA